MGGDIFYSLYFFHYICRLVHGEMGEGVAILSVFHSLFLYRSRCGLSLRRVALREMDLEAPRVEVSFLPLLLLLLPDATGLE